MTRPAYKDLYLRQLSAHAESIKHIEQLEFLLSIKQDQFVSQMRTIKQLERELEETHTELAESIKERIELGGQLSRYRSKYYNLLAVAHRDGGQYLAQHGEDAAGEDAITAILTAYHNNDCYQGAVEVEGYLDLGGELHIGRQESLKFKNVHGKVKVLVLPERVGDASKTMKEVE